jgi:hypothetical protein
MAEAGKALSTTKEKKEGRKEGRERGRERGREESAASHSLISRTLRIQG